MNVFYHSIDHPLKPWVVGGAGNKVIADLASLDTKVKLGCLWWDAPVKWPNEVCVDVHVNATELLQHQQSPKVCLGRADLQLQIGIKNLGRKGRADEFLALLRHHEAELMMWGHAPVEKVIEVDGQRDSAGEVGLPDDSRNVGRWRVGGEKRLPTSVDGEPPPWDKKMENKAGSFQEIRQNFDALTNKAF